MIAALPMYFRPENADAHAALWSAIRDGLRARGIEAPDALDHSRGIPETWGAPDLVLGQICNLPYRTRFRHVTRIATCDYGLEGCGPGEYRSLIVTRADGPDDMAAALDGRRLALNEPMSHSGWGSVWLLARDLGVTLNPALVTGAHEASALAVLDGSADVAAIDAHTWRLLTAALPRLTGLKVVGATRSSPGMTLITRAGQDPAPYFDAISEALHGGAADAAAALGLTGIHRLPDSAYEIDNPPELALQ